MAKNRTVTLTDNTTGKSFEAPVIEGTHGKPVIDIKGMVQELGFFVHDPGYASTSSCRSAITYIDGDKGVLLYRGYPIEQLAESSSYLEVCYLLLFGELPVAGKWEDFNILVRRHTMVHEGIRRFMNGYRADAHPMGMLVGIIGALSTFYHDSLDIDDFHHRVVTAHRLIAKMPTLAAMSHKFAQGQPFMYPRNDLDYSANFLYMMFGSPCEDYEVNPVLARAMDRIFLLHADHEQNASTSTVRLAGSSDANPFAAVASGIAALWGPAHGGANEAVVRMLIDINDSGKPLQAFVDRAKDKNDSFRLMGFGHRVYKNYDPRAKIIKEMADRVFDVTGRNRLLDIALELERIALEDDYFVSRKLYPNVDFYSGIIFQAMGIPVNNFTVMFAMGRLAGWIAQWIEFHRDGQAIGRPRQVYIGETKREYVPEDRR